MRKKLESFCRANGLVYYPDRIKIMEGEDIYLRTKGKYDSIAKSARGLMSIQNSQNVLTNNTDGCIIKSSNYTGELAIPYSDDQIPTKIKDALSKLKEYGDTIEVDTPYKFREMSLLSRQTGTEFASISVNGRNIIIKGNNAGVNLSHDLLEEIKKHKGVLNCHSHPYIGDLQPSMSDIELAKFMDWQEEFNIITPDMQQCVYDRFGIIEVNKVSSDLSEDEIEILKKLFGG